MRWFRLHHEFPGVLEEGPFPGQDERHRRRRGERGAEQQGGCVAGQPLHGGAGVYSGDRRARVDCAGMSEQVTPISPGRQEAPESRPELLAELDRRNEEILRLRDLLIGKDAELGAAKGRVAELEARSKRMAGAKQRLESQVPEPREAGRGLLRLFRGQG